MPVDWEAVARVGGTIAVLMGVAKREEIARRLMAGGLPADTPVAAVTWGTRPEQRTVRTTLGRLAAEPIESPAVHGRRGGGRPRPAAGTRTGPSSAGASSSPGPGNRPPGSSSGSTSWGRRRSSCRSSRSANRPTAARRSGRPPVGWATTTGWPSPRPTPSTASSPPSARSAPTPGPSAAGGWRPSGPGTADALAAAGVRADLVPERFVAESLLEAFPDGPGRVLLPRAAVARDALPAGLTDRGWTVDVVEAYRTAVGRPAAGGPGRRRPPPTPSPSRRRRR